MKLWTKITKDTSNALYNLLPNKLNRPLRQRGHDFELPSLKTERFKNCFVNRCFLNLYNHRTIISYYHITSIHICKLRRLF